MGKNPEIAKGINALGRSKAFSKSGRFRFVKKGKDAKKVEKKAAPAAATSAKAKPAQKYYEADDIKTPRKTINRKATPAKLRKSITPGTVLILLAGRFQGKRVVFLKQLKSGMLLVTGPYEINGVPLRRVNQAYVIATSTKVDLSKVKVPETIADEYFAREKVAAGGKTDEAAFFKQGQEKPADAEWMKKRKADQKSVDTAVSAAVNAVPALKVYLGARFSLSSSSQPPHLMKF